VSRFWLCSIIIVTISPGGHKPSGRTGKKEGLFQRVDRAAPIHRAATEGEHARHQPETGG